MTNSFFTNKGADWFVHNKHDGESYDQLPAGNYSVQHSDRIGFYLSTLPTFELPPKIYGNTNNYSERIFNTFMSRDGSTGVLLSGEKGSGKTLLAKKLSLIAIENGVPVINVSSAFSGQNFNTFIQGIDQPAVVFVDEFEKLYDEDSGKQEEMLTLLDGVFNSKKLFILTCNNKWKIDENMHNRPSRIFYSISYSGVDKEFINQYCEDNLKDKSKKSEIVAISHLFRAFNFDQLKGLVEEINRYGGSVSNCIDILNIKPEHSDVFDYRVEIKSIDNAKILYEHSDISDSPFDENFKLFLNVTRIKPNINKNIESKIINQYKEDNYISSEFRSYVEIDKLYVDASNFQNVFASTGEITFTTKKYEVKLIPNIQKQKNYFYDKIAF